MKRSILFAAFTALLVLGACDSPSLMTESPGTQDAVMLSEAQRSAAAETAAPEFAPSYILMSNSKSFPKNLEAKVEAAGGTITGRVDEIGVAFATSSDPTFADNVKGVSVGSDILFSVSPYSEYVLSGDEALPDEASAGDDEPYFGYLWGMQQIGAPAAWNAGVRGEGVLIAVLDEGFGLDHPDVPFRQDLAQSYACWTVIDGVAYLSNDPNDCEPAQYLLSDIFSHGTHVAGTIAARDNGAGVIGVAPDAEIMPVKVLSEILGGGTASWIIQGIIYATDMGADVINMSIGGASALGIGKGSSDVAHALNAYRRAVDYARKNGVTVVTSAGNDAHDGDGNGPIRIRPADFPSAISISATGPTGDPASYTNYGTSLVDLAAPGGEAGLSTNFILSTGAHGGYYFSAGTSMAAPHASGVAALILGENGGSMKPAQVEAEMRKRAQDLGKPGRDDYYGHGLVHTGY